MKSKKKKGFTLVELIVVIVIIGILAAVLVPSLTKYIDKANYSKDVQSVKTLNTYLENNSLLFYDMEINSREDVIELLKAENPEKELNLTVKSKGYYIWYDIDNKEIIFETYENLEVKSGKQKLSARNPNSDRSCLSEFFKGYYFLDEGDSSLYKVIEIIENLKDAEKNKKQSNTEVANILIEALLKVKSDGYQKAYEYYAENLNGFSIEIDDNTKFEIKVSDYKIELKLTIDVLKCNHESITTVEARDATCTEDGNIEYYVCKCGKIFSDESLTNAITISDTVIEAKGHKEEVIKEGKAATCTESGLTEETKCTVCKEIIQHQTEISALGHTEVIDEAIEATCTTVGKTEGKHCSVCHEVLVEQIEIAAAGHTEVVDAKVEPTCTEKGKTEGKHCSVCNEVIVKQDEIAALGHEYSTEWKIDTTHHYHKCSRCDDEKDKEEHIPDYEEATEEHGIQCKVCGHIIASPLSHIHTIKDTVEARDATCTEDGNKQYYICKCGKKFSDISLKNEISDSEIVVKAKGHIEVIDKGVSATCTETGLTEGKYCSVCEKILVAQTIIPAGHTYDNDDDMICNGCGHNRTSKVEVKFILPNGTLVHNEDVAFMNGVSGEGLEKINNYKTTVSKESNYQVFKEFLGWYEQNDSTKTLVTDFNQITENKVFVALIKETVRSYNINIYHDDKDNIIADSTYLTSETIENHKFGTDINIKKQIQYNSLYLFYMSPKATFGESDWLNLVNSVSNKDSNGVISLYDSGNNLEFLANITFDESSATGTLELVVLCVQPAAIVSTSASIAWESGITINTDCEFYLTVEEALKAANNGKTEYIRIYGQGKKSISASAYLPDTNPTINKHSVKINNITYTIPSYSLDMESKYTLGYDKNKEFTIETLDTVILPYSRNDTTSEGYLLEQSSSLPDTIHSYLMINEKTNLNINGSLVVGGVVASWGQYAVGVVSTRAVIMNNGNIICSSGAKVLSYGYIKGENGTLELKNGATLVDVFKSYDYPGGSISTALNNASIFPIQVYSFHNVSCELKINYGATFKVYGQIYASGDFLMKENITILGNDGMFELTDDDGYIIKSVEDTTKDTYINTKFTSSNQDVTQREVLNIYGSFTDNSIKLKLSSLGSISTSKSKAMPIGLMRFVLNKGTGKLNSVSYKFLPGSELIINDDATLEIASGVKVVFYDSSYDDNFTYKVDGSETKANFRYSIVHSAWFSQEDTSKIGSKLIVNGYLNVKGNLGGKIDSTSNGKLALSNKSVKIVEPKTVNLTYMVAIPQTNTYYANGLINGTETKTFETGVTYYYTDEGYWSPVEN